MAWEFEIVTGLFNPRVTEGPTCDGKAVFFGLQTSRASIRPLATGFDFVKTLIE